MSKFESKGKTFEFDPQKDNVQNPMEGKSGENLTAYYGRTLGPPIVEEIRVWVQLIGVLKDGLPKPYDNTVIINKINQLERKTGEDLSALKNCCPPSAEVREAKEFKPLIFGILDRIVEIGEIRKYVDKYE